MFQSSPNPRVGRSQIIDEMEHRHGRFNPRPTQGSGAAGRCLGAGASELVSILAQPKGRAQPGCPVAGAAFQAFQSSPNPRVGRSRMIGGATSRLLKVSILAQPKGRAQLVDKRAIDHTKAFQSSPNPRVGRSPSARRRWSASRPCFNPRPTQGSGAARADRALRARHCQVSILAQPKGRAQRDADPC